MTKVNENTTAAKSDSRKTEINKALVFFDKAGVWILVVCLMAIGFIINPTDYFSVGNIRSILQAISLTGMCCAGLAYIVYSSNMNDMSLPMTIAFSGMVSIQLVPFGIVVCILGGLLTGTLVGIINGFMIGKLRANPIIWTLAFNMVSSGIARVAWGGSQIYPDVVAGGNEAALATAETFNQLARTYFFGGSVSLMMVVMVVMFIISYFIMTHTKFGNQLKIVGTNYETARLSGLNVVRIITLSYIICSFCASVCGLFYASMRKIGSYDNGMGYDFSCLTAVLLGGMTLLGGKGSMVGVFGGVLAVGMLNNVMTLIGISTFNQYLVTGIVFLLIVWLNTKSARKLGRA